jgi:hypothetical protein
MNVLRIFLVAVFAVCSLSLTIGCGPDQSQPNPSLGNPTEKAPAADPSKSKAGALNDPKKR